MSALADRTRPRCRFLPVFVFVIFAGLATAVDEPAGSFLELAARTDVGAELYPDLGMGYVHDDESVLHAEGEGLDTATRDDLNMGDVHDDESMLHAEGEGLDTATHDDLNVGDVHDDESMLHAEGEGLDTATHDEELGLDAEGVDTAFDSDEFDDVAVHEDDAEHDAFVDDFDLDDTETDRSLDDAETDRALDDAFAQETSASRTSTYHPHRYYLNHCEHCHSDLQCKSKKCVNSGSYLAKCVAHPSHYRRCFKPECYSCRGPSDCLSRMCLNWKCVNRKRWKSRWIADPLSRAKCFPPIRRTECAKCSRHVDCRSRYCLSYKCVNRKWWKNRLIVDPRSKAKCFPRRKECAKCLRPLDCQSNYCLNQKCINRLWWKNRWIPNPRSKAKCFYQGKECAKCRLHLDCQSRYCLNTRCVNRKWWQNKWVVNPHSKAKCSPGKKECAWCRDNDQCLSKWCVSNKCVQRTISSRRKCLGKGRCGLCRNSLHCRPGLFCKPSAWRGKPGRCNVRLGWGSACGHSCTMCNRDLLCKRGPTRLTCVKKNPLRTCRICKTSGDCASNHECKLPGRLGGHKRCVKKVGSGGLCNHPCLVCSKDLFCTKDRKCEKKPPGTCDSCKGTDSCEKGFACKFPKGVTADGKNTGTCKAEKQEGEECQENCTFCEEGLFCKNRSPTKKTCEKPRSKKCDPCTSSDGCMDKLVCKFARGVTADGKNTGRCETEKKVDEDCNEDCTHCQDGHFCKNISPTKRSCAKRRLNACDPCTDSDECRGDLVCKFSTGVKIPGVIGKCAEKNGLNGVCNHDCKVCKDNFICIHGVCKEKPSY